MDILIRQHFGLAAEPWKGFHLATADLDAIGALARAAAADQSMVQVVGPHGSGKTHAVLHELQHVGADVVRVERLDRERTTMSDVITALVEQLSDERVRHSGEARTRQARRLLGLSRRPVVVVVDDAHVLHYSTLSGLKRLRELSWAGRKAPLVGLVLCGQKDRCAGLPEVGLRTSTFTLGGLTTEEAETALQRVCGSVLEAGAIRRLAAAAPGRVWIELQDTADLALTIAAARGETKVSEASMAAALDPAKARAAVAAEKPAGLGDALTKLEAVP